ncbi:enoyl-CoA hydratase/isomerase family protein [[Mycobacterium] vasticus]|uniref:Enoyl-CoA hydratase/isomerase family protein n=1 Tax=[Mycobacterium] vasticus TaxID=2875777 RepID=A0ABU5Z247_9MYCO|nr:enoyl-CoA hydratase/isomerase family protein [Mycolicibacter sp. MYC017]MEB3071472.1 enoyl-CoA hydratase/isomerase family protein [Mycolicibacter sp. MYC017]
MPLQIIDLADTAASGGVAGPVIAVGDITSTDNAILDRVSFTLTEQETDDRRAVTVPSVEGAVDELFTRVGRWPQAASVCDDVLRCVVASSSPSAGVAIESLGYSTLQAGPEFTRWCFERGPAQVAEGPDPLLVEREGNTLLITFNRPQRHNAFSNATRQALLDALTVAQIDPSIDEVLLQGNGPSFCSGGDLAEFGALADAATAHLARTRYSPALAIIAITARLGTSCRAVIHGQVLGSGLEMAAFCGHVTCRPGAVLGLPELRLGLIPGAGGTVSVSRRIGRWRTAYLVLSGKTIDPATALAWGLVDAVTR